MRAEDGCRESRIYRDVEDGEVFFLSVDWKDVANLEHYMRSVSGSALLGAVDLLSETARFRVDKDAP
jgi:quinol monooxygenase YgiN